jgi:hypothetical protein
MRWAGPLLQRGDYLSAILLDLAVIMVGLMGVCITAAAVSCAFRNLIESRGPQESTPPAADG